MYYSPVLPEWVQKKSNIKPGLAQVNRVASTPVKEQAQEFLNNLEEVVSNTTKLPDVIISKETESKSKIASNSEEEIHKEPLNIKSTIVNNADNKEIILSDVENSNTSESIFRNFAKNNDEVLLIEEEPTKKPTYCDVAKKAVDLSLNQTTPYNFRPSTKNKYSSSQPKSKVSNKI